MTFINSKGTIRTVIIADKTHLQNTYYSSTVPIIKDNYLGTNKIQHFKNKYYAP
jgi:hypothetical protein